MTNYLQNIIFTYLRATEEELHNGAHWYDRTNALARELSPDDVWRGAGVIASFSPLCPWSRNVTLARNAFATGIASGHTKQQCLSAQRILDGEHPLYVLKGDKTRAFTAAIADPANSTIATIDCHAHDIAMGRVFPGKQRNIGKRLFRDIGDAYTEAGHLTGYSTPQIQAITWVAHRRIIGADWRDRIG